MLVLSRQRDETIMIGDIPVTVVDICGDKVRLGIEAPKDVPVHRKEIYDAIRRENRAAGAEPASSPGIVTLSAWLPEPDCLGVYTYPDGSDIFRSDGASLNGSLKMAGKSEKWCARWADHSFLTSDNDQRSYFDSPEDAAMALAMGGEGPSSRTPVTTVAGGGA